MSRWNKDKKDSEQTMQLLKNEILEYFRYAISTDDKETLLSIGRITPEGRDLLSMLRKEAFKNKDIEVVLNASNLRHIYINHYGQNEKDKGNNIPLTDDDICSIGDMMANTTDIVYGIDKKDKLGKYFFLSRSKDGTYNLSELYSDKWGRLNIRSLYNTKKGPSQRVMAIMSTLLPTSATYSGLSLSSVAKIPKLFELHKDFDEKIPLERNFRVLKLSEEHGISLADVKAYITARRHGDNYSQQEIFEHMSSVYKKEHPYLDENVVDRMMGGFRLEIDELVDIRFKESRINAMFDQISAFKEQTGIQLEIKDGHPYYGKSLNLRGKRKLTKLPEGLEVDGWLTISNTPIETLPKNLRARNVNADGCPIRNILSGIHIDNLLFLDNNPCENIYISPDLDVRELSLQESSIKKLSEGLNIDTLVVANTHLTKLPKDLTADAIILHRSGITEIPETVNVRAVLGLEQNIKDRRIIDIITERINVPSLSATFTKEQQDIIIDHVRLFRTTEEKEEVLSYLWSEADYLIDRRFISDELLEDARKELMDLASGTVRNVSEGQKY